MQDTGIGYETKRKGVEVDSRLIKRQNSNINKSACHPDYRFELHFGHQHVAIDHASGVWFKVLCYEPISVIS